MSFPGIHADSSTAQEHILKPYGIKSGIIEYATPVIRPVREPYYFDDYGMKSAMYMETVTEGEKSKGWVVSYGDYQYMWDPDQSAQGMKMRNPLLYWISEVVKERHLNHLP